MTKFINTVGWLTFWAFLGLKLSAAVAWSWVIVFIPLMVVGGLYLVVLTLFAIVGGAAALAVKKKGQSGLEELFGTARSATRDNLRRNR